MECIVLGPSKSAGRQWQYDVENLGADWRCIPVAGAEKALLYLADWTDILLLLPCRESAKLLRTLSEDALLAPPFILGGDAPDGPLPDAEELPSLVQAWRRSLCLPALSVRHMPATMDIASALFHTLDVPKRLRARSFLPEMAALTVVHPPLLSDLTHGLYPLIARRYGMTPAGVERSLRLCVESTWMHGSLEAMERFFGHSVDPERGKPTNREFLCRVQERLTLTMRKLL